MTDYFSKLLTQMGEVRTKKSTDYAAAHNPNENFERAALIASWFKHDRDKPFAIYIATKMARLATLLNSEAEPNNESIEDTFIDQANYTLLWADATLNRTKVKSQIPQPPSQIKPCFPTQHNWFYDGVKNKFCSICGAREVIG